MNDCNVFVFYIAICGGGETQKMRIYKSNNLFAKCKKKTGRNIWVVQPVIAVGSALATIYYMKKNLCLFFLSDDDVKVVRIWISTG